MGKYSCEKCAKIFSQKSQYDKHLTRKIPCEIQRDKINTLIDKAVEEKLIEINKKLISTKNENNITIKNTEQMDISKMCKLELLDKCKELGIAKCSSKNKSQLIELINGKNKVVEEPSATNTQIIDVTPTNVVVNTRDIIPIYKLKVLSLFSGCGGLDYGFHRLKEFDVMKSYDSMKHAVETYNLNFTSKAEQFDVKYILTPEFNLGFSPDIIIGGPPCQDFSIAGDKTLGDRANLTETYIDIICKYKPLYFVMENVPTIRTIGKSVYDKIIKKLKDACYGLSVNVIYMPDYCIPQERKRLVIIGKLGGVDGIFDTLLIEAKNPIKSIREYIKKTNIDIGINGKEHIYRHPRNYSRRGVFSIDELYPTVRGCLRKMPPSYEFHEGDTTKIRDYVISPDWNMVARIQTFPPSFKFANKNNAIIIGNAVPPKFSEVLANIIKTHHITS
jgi:DNA (cytosine-5)-methyltransferase 1